MAYEKQTWTNHVVEHEKRYVMVKNDDGTTTLIDAPGETVCEGTPQDADHFNHMENGIYEAHTELSEKAAVYWFGATIAADGWAGDAAPYTQTVEVAGLLATDRPKVDLVTAGVTTAEAAETLETAFAMLFAMESGDGTLTAICYKDAPPEVDIPVKMEVVR